jgi:hypothetical protein
MLLCKPLFRLLESPADSENVAVRMAHVHLANIPRHVGGWPRDLETLLEAALVDRVDVVHSNRHPHALVRRIVALRPERFLDSAPASAALGVLTQKDFALAGAHAAERGGIAPVPTLLPSELLEPGEALLDIRHIQDWCQPSGEQMFFFKTHGEIAAGNLRPVTITLTNVKLRTALDAVCDNALCSWVVVDGSLKVTPLPSEPSAALPSTVSFSVYDVSPTDALRALAAAIDVPLTVEPSLPSNRLTLNFKNASTAFVLNALCNMVQCAWDFDPTRGLRITHKQ